MRNSGLQPSLISCIVPVLNGEDYLRDALDSIVEQTYRPIEIIVADDGSTDGTAAVAKSYGERVSYLRQPNAGPAAARNLGLSATRGELVAFLDADDLWHPEKLSRQAQCLRSRPDLDLCLAQATNFWAAELLDERRRAGDERVVLLTPYTLISALIRRSFLQSVGGFDPNRQLGEDTDWFLRATEHGARIEILPEVLAYRRLHRGNLTRAHRAVSKEALLQKVKASLDERRRSRRA